MQLSQINMQLLFETLGPQDGQTGCVGLNMNYSIIFTEISFYPETNFYRGCRAEYELFNYSIIFTEISFYPEN